jgi:hypothetical protein
MNTETNSAAPAVGQQRLVLHLLRNPYGHSEEELRAARLLAAELLEMSLATLRHAEVFVGSRERMHPDGLALYKENISNLEKELAPNQD